MAEIFLKILSNSIKSLFILLIGSLLFVTIITLFPLIGSLTIYNFPIGQVIKDNFKLLVPLIFVSLIISPFLGWASFKILKKRFLKLLAIGLIGNWIAIILVMLIWSNFNVDKNEIDSYLFLSLWAFLAYSGFSIPILVPSILIIERWTRKNIK
jgi:putative effector of murein hydrolase